MNGGCLGLYRIKHRELRNGGHFLTLDAWHLAAILATNERGIEIKLTGDMSNTSGLSN